MSGSDKPNIVLAIPRPLKASAVAAFSRSPDVENLAKFTVRAYEQLIRDQCPVCKKLDFSTTEYCLGTEIDKRCRLNIGSITQDSNSENEE